MEELKGCHRKKVYAVITCKRFFCSLDKVLPSEDFSFPRKRLQFAFRNDWLEATLDGVIRSRTTADLNKCIFVQIRAQPRYILSKKSVIP